MNFCHKKLMPSFFHLFFSVFADSSLQSPKAFLKTVVTNPTIRGVNKGLIVALVSNFRFPFFVGIFVIKKNYLRAKILTF